MLQLVEEAFDTARHQGCDLQHAAVVIQLGMDAPVNRQISAMIVSLEKGEEVALAQLCALAS